MWCEVKKMLQVWGVRTQIVEGGSAEPAGCAPKPGEKDSLNLDSK